MLLQKIISITILLLVATETRIVTKRSDIDLQICIENFDVHKDKIIRTQDSKDMGAKYINEIDLGSREECLRLCCETDNCDVFVFEEKNTGSCYLFQCGPPEDFKCKFTHHANYSSAILAVNRHLPDLESQIKLTKHEQDLSKLSLKKSELVTEANTKAPEAKQTTPSAVTQSKLIRIATNSPFENKEVKCSRYQFECRSTKECIAIYNACDGIPQCSDGSDEAPELGCPSATTPSANPARQLNYDNVPQSQNRPINAQGYVAAPKQFQPPVRGGHPQQSSEDFLRPPDSRNPFIPHSSSFDAPSHVGMYPQTPSQSQNWLPHQAQVPLQYQPYEDKNSRIFTHKESGLQVAEGQELSQTSYDLNRDSPKISYYDDYRVNPQYQEKWKGNDDHYSNQFIQDNSQNPRDWQQQKPPIVPEYKPESYHKNVVEYNAPTVDHATNWQPQKEEHEHHEHEKMAHELKHSKDLMPNAKKEEKQIKIEKAEKQPSHTGPRFEKYKVAEVLDLQDGIAETPGGAVLSLTLGLIITCVMALLIGCRLRVVRKRIRRGGKSYAHDADYLVNGMYL